MTDSNILDKSMRSVFVGNIPYEATEEKLKDIFNEVGPVLSFKLVYDRETGKPKGYGFCEYKDQETALSAMRNLNGFEIGGRSLRVDNACTEKSRLEMQSLLAGPPVDNTYGEAVESDKAPEEISKAVASLPPEQMFELMKQMKLCIQNNPAEGKQMLLQNPQLAYALLQAQVVMRIVDPQVAVTMLHKVMPTIPPMTAPNEPQSRPPPAPAPVPAPPRPVEPPVPPPPPRVSTHPPTPNPHAQFMGQDMDMRSLDPRASIDPRGGTGMDPRGNSIDPRGGGGGGISVDPRGGGPGVPIGMDPRSGGNIPGPPGIDLQRGVGGPALPPMAVGLPTMDPRGGAGGGGGMPSIPSNPIDQRSNAIDSRPPPPPPIDPRSTAGRGDQDLRIPPMAPSMPPHPIFPPEHPGNQQRDPRDQRYQRDPRAAAAVRAPPAPVAPPASRPPAPGFNTTIPTGASDQEKAALIMQVLQLSDDQIAMLPPEQRQSILVLKEQIAKSTQR